jgi:hypothetical protein
MAKMSRNEFQSGLKSREENTMRNRRLIWLIGIVFLLSMTLLTVSCGGSGGSDDGDSNQSSGPPATMNQTSARQAMGVLQFGTSVGGMYDDTQVKLGSGEIGLSSLNARTIIATVLRLTEQNILTGDTRSGSGSFNEACLAGGNMVFTANWSGPDLPADCAQISNLTAAVSMNSCGLGSGLTMDGDFKLTLSGSSCAPTAIRISFNDINFSDTGEQMSVQIDSLDIIMTDISYYNTDDFITHAQLVIDGDASGTLGANTYQAEFDNFTTIMDTPDNYDFEFQYSGSLTGTCLDGWVTLTTLVPVEISASGDCPTAGQVQLSGDIDLLITFNPDTTVTVGDTAYSDCESVESSCSF